MRNSRSQANQHAAQTSCSLPFPLPLDFVSSTPTTTSSLVFRRRATRSQSFMNAKPAERCSADRSGPPPFRDGWEGLSARRRVQVHACVAKGMRARRRGLEEGADGFGRRDARASQLVKRPEGGRRQVCGNGAEKRDGDVLVDSEMIGRVRLLRCGRWLRKVSGRPDRYGQRYWR